MCFFYLCATHSRDICDVILGLYERSEDSLDTGLSAPPRGPELLLGHRAVAADEVPELGVPAGDVRLLLANINDSFLFC